MKTRIIQPLYLKGEQAAYDTLKWEIDELSKCDESLDLIVLPESSDVQALMPDKETRERVIARCHQPLMDMCAATAKRCKAVVFANAVDTSPLGHFNTTFAFDTTGALVGKYRKEHLTPGESVRFGPAATAYTREWTEPYVLTIDGVRYAFMTCYDFYFYENYANIARLKPDVIIGCSHQRSDPHPILEFLNAFCAYNTATYLVRASVSMGLDATVGGSSMVVTPEGKILGNLKSRQGVLDVTIDPFKKYLKPAGFGNPLATHPEYVEKGRRPWKYRPGGSAIVPGFADAPAERPAPVEVGPSAAGNTLATLGAAAATGVAEVVFDVEVRDGRLVTPDGVALADILRKLSCHILMNIRRKGGWTDADIRRFEAEVRRFDAEGHVKVVKPNGDGTDGEKEFKGTGPAKFPASPGCQCRGRIRAEGTAARGGEEVRRSLRGPRQVHVK